MACGLKEGSIFKRTSIRSLQGRESVLKLSFLSKEPSAIYFNNTDKLLSRKGS
jgi:hypothetical protein